MDTAKRAGIYEKNDSVGFLPVGQPERGLEVVAVLEFDGRRLGFEMRGGLRG
jgi:hypothetical protein